MSQKKLKQHCHLVLIFLRASGVSVLRIRRANIDCNFVIAGQIGRAGNTQPKLAIRMAARTVLLIMFLDGTMSESGHPHPLHSKGWGIHVPHLLQGSFSSESRRQIHAAGIVVTG
jgi:hypothetical protein